MYYYEEIIHAAYSENKEHKN